MVPAWAAAAVAATPSEVCDAAADRFAGCGFAAGEASARAACRDDPPTVALYEACLPRAGCEPFLACIDEVVREAAEARPTPAPDPGATRAEQCEVHVDAGLWSIALGVVVHDRDEGVEEGRACLLGGAPLESCLRPVEREIVEAYARQRLADCRRWPEPMAACVLGLPGASGCDPDVFPLWRLSKRSMRRYYGRSSAWDPDLD